MLISKINLSDSINGFAQNKSNTSNKNQNKIQVTNPDNFKKYDSQILKSYYINFTGKNSLSNDFEYDNSAVKLESDAMAVAQKYKRSTITHYDVLKVFFNDISQFIDDLDNNKCDMHDITENDSATILQSVISSEIFKKEEYRKDLKAVIEEYQETLDEKLATVEAPKNKKITTELENDIIALRDNMDRNESVITSSDILLAMMGTYSSEVGDIFIDFTNTIKDFFMIENEEISKRLDFQNYTKKSELILKNLTLGENVVVTYDNNKIDHKHFIPNLINTFNNGNNKLNPQNTELLEFNKNATGDYVSETIRILSKNKDKDYILIIPHDEIKMNHIDATGTDIVYNIPVAYIQAIKNVPKNIHIVLFNNKDSYLSQNSFFDDYSEISIPALQEKDVLDTLNKHKEITQNISKPALKKIVKASSQMQGTYPNKTLELIHKLSINTDKAEITVKDVETFIKEADHLFRKNDNNSSFEVIFDTGKRLSDMTGKENTKKEAENIIQQIKRKKIGTEGIIIYSQDGTVGSGRRHTAEVIAGETHTPFFAINTMDFGTKDVDLFDGEMMTPEASIKKIFSMVSTQAESNPLKSAVLFIDNFELFSVGEMVSEYHQKAMAQLIREMNNADKKGLNIIVIGSVSKPELIGETTMKSFKFSNSIEVSSPAFNEKERYDILKCNFAKEKIKIEGDSKQQDELLKSAAKTLKGFPYMELKQFIKTAVNIAQERNHKTVTKSDMTESYLRITTGRPSIKEIQPHEKELNTKHECGHALIAQVLHDIFEASGKNWLIPDEVNFITLDPRGVYGAAMYSKREGNDEGTFETFFCDIACTYGGHSCEKHFYDMDGSWGITGDLAAATESASHMVTKMGQGYYTGKISLDGLHGSKSTSLLTENMRNKIEKDIDIITRNALTVSDAIVETYEGFINKFSDKYSKFVGTGECIIDGDIFRQELSDWTAAQPKSKQAEIAVLNQIIFDAIKASKNGKIY